MISEDLNKARELLGNNEVIGLPTETVYGLAACISSDAAIKKIFEVKKRPFFDPLIVHVSQIDQAKKLTTEWSEMAQTLAEKFWPGPLTLVLKKNNHVSDMITSGLETVALRCPDHEIALLMIDLVGPLAAPSANRFGKTSPTTSHHVENEFKDQNIFVLEGGPCKVGIESTILEIRGTELMILRKGLITPEQITQTLKSKELEHTWAKNLSASISAPGQLKHHYMPSVPLVFLNRFIPLAELGKEAQEKFSQMQQEENAPLKPESAIKKFEFIKLSLSPHLAARELYSELRRASEKKPDVLIFIKEGHQLGDSWDAILDRMTKAASLVI